MNESKESEYVQLSCSDTHCVGLSHAGRAFSWALTAQGDRFGQLCRSTKENIYQPHEVSIGQRIVAVGAGGSRSTGHTALVGEDGSLFMCGCDRWQQLGLSLRSDDLSGNAAGYTWSDGKIWQSSPQKVIALNSVKIIKVTPVIKSTSEFIIVKSPLGGARTRPHAGTSL